MSTHDTDYDPTGEFAAVDTDIELVVEDTDLPRRLKTEVYREIDDRGLDVEGAQEVATAIESRYFDTRVDPLDPVGTVSAQSIGEPGTQMSIPGDEQILIRRNGETDVTTIWSLVDGLASVRRSTSVDGHEVIPAPEGMEVPSLRTDERVEWTPLEEVSRHEAPEELLKFDLESGRSIRATKAHSFVTREDNEVVPVAGDDLEEGDWLPIVSSLDGDGQDTVDLREYLSADDYWFTSALTDGGTTTLPGGEDQIRNKRDALDAGEIDEESVYPVQGTVGLPEEFTLDEQTGFFVGAFLAEGNLTEHYVSISNVDSEFQDRIRSFADRFDLSVNEYENDSGFATGYDIRVNGTVLADLIRAIATADGHKVVPEFAFGATTPFVTGLLEGYFSGDGNVSSNAVRASSTSEALIEGIGLLLARFDIYATFGTQDNSTTLRVPTKFVPAFEKRIGMVGERGEDLEALASQVDPDGPDATDQIPNFGDALKEAASDAGIPARQVNSAHKRQRIGRNRLESLLTEMDGEVDTDHLDALKRALNGDVVWDRIDSIERIEPDGEYVYDLSVAGLDTFTTAEGVVTHNTMNTFHYAGVAEIDVTQGLPRLIELVDARKEPDTPMMTVHLDAEHATDRERAHEVVWKIESTRILQLGDVSTNVADMVVGIELNPDTLAERWPTIGVEEAADEIESTIADTLGVDTRRSETVIEFGPEEPSYRELLQLVEELRDITFKGISDVSRVVIRKEETDHPDREEEFVLYTEGSALSEVLDIEGVDASRTTCNNIHEIYECLGIEAAREAIINETMNTLEEQGLDDVNVRHLMLVADIMTNRGEIQSIGRHGISGNKDSVLARAAFEVTVSHLLDAAIQGEIDDLDGVTENVIVGKPIKLGTGDVNLRMGSGD